MLINESLILYVIFFKSLTSWLNKRFNPSINSHESDLIKVVIGMESTFKEYLKYFTKPVLHHIGQNGFNTNNGKIFCSCLSNKNSIKGVFMMKREILDG